MQSNQTGSIAVVVALIMTLLLSVMAFTMDTGYLYLKRDQYQNAVEAAAMAGAVSLCEDNPENVAREIAMENISGLESALEQKKAVLTIRTGFYDENDSYGNFTTYEDFVTSSNSDFPSGEYNNAIMVSLSVESGGLSGMIQMPEDSDESTITIRAAAVAYLRAYGMLSLGEEEGDGIYFSDFTDNQPTIADGWMHANGDIVFDNADESGQPNIESSAWVSATGTISGYAGGDSGVDSVSLKPVSAYLEDLRNRAYRILSVDDFPSETGVEQTDADGNIYTLGVSGHLDSPVFHPFIGDHNGNIYYFESDDVIIHIENPPGANNGDEIKNLTLVSETGIRYWPREDTVAWGGENNDQLLLIAAEDISFGDDPMPTSENHFSCMGVVLWADGTIIWEVAAWGSFLNNPRYIRMLAGDSIQINEPYSAPISTGFDMKFGPPCPPYDVKLGRLVTP